ncbi:hypothetical protein [Vreelandella populi]|uniref:hypothetical protein n=1 Tax=Vreelandella populi TaxID=2498858 RepID=UPI000F8F1D93|nr:hypothetical protein [Halomonas populi]RUR56358.1 hypothetical protein ELY40_04155 [Halomonas populi]
MEFIDNHLDRVNPKPFIVWFLVSGIAWFASFLGMPLDFVFGNATYLNVVYGTVICTAIMFLSCILLPCPWVKDQFFHKAHSISKLFSDTALGASGFIAVGAIHNDKYQAVALLLVGVLVYVLVGNHIFHSIFNENKGSLRFFRKIDKISSTKLGDDAEMERNIEKMALAITASIASIVIMWLFYVFSTIRA